jgi:L-cysteine:1D-myo-inositol 2-amino-2-deoxy-alpha-D-glucopyranoside ligase
MSAAQSAALTHDDTFARHYVHQAMVAFEGTKMSKSRGNLVLVSKLRADGVDPMAIRLVLLDQHYRTGWEYTPDLLVAAVERLARWREALSVNQGADAASTIAAVRAAIAADLDTRAALAAVDAWAERTLAGQCDDAGAPGLVARTVDAVLGVRL